MKQSKHTEQLKQPQQSQQPVQPQKTLTLNQLVEHPSENEVIKDNSNYLRGTIIDDIMCGKTQHNTANINADNAQLTKFHGTYIQDNRDVRLSRQQKKLEPEWGFMIRVRMPSGNLTAKQWLQMDELANKWAGSRLKLTTRQAIQFHGIIKFDLQKSMQALYQAGMDSIAACGDVNRNVMCSPITTQRTAHQQILACAEQISKHLLPATTAWYDIWIDGKKQTELPENTNEPIYGKHYLPRKFKIAITIPPNNDTDIFTNDIGLIAIIEKQQLIGFNVAIGGGLGTTHSDKTTYPRLATLIGFCTPEQVISICEHVMTIQRDYGNRTERKHARLKYTLDRVGIDWFKQELQRRSNITLKTVKPYQLQHNGDLFGWIKDEQNFWHTVLPIEHGQVKDTASYPLKTAIRTLAEQQLCNFRLTGNQNLALIDISEKHKPLVQKLLQQHHIQADASHLSGLRRHAVACVALPTCALAMAEAQRYLPELIEKIEPILQQHQLLQEDINIRMTGCPNGCGRPWTGEISFIGKSSGRYNMYLGAAFNGERLNQLYRENLDEAEILQELNQLIANYANHRQTNEHFGDYIIRNGTLKQLA